MLRPNKFQSILPWLPERVVDACLPACMAAVWQMPAGMPPRPALSSARHSRCRNMSRRHPNANHHQIHSISLECHSKTPSASADTPQQRVHPPMAAPKGVLLLCTLVVLGTLSEARSLRQEVNESGGSGYPPARLSCIAHHLRCVGHSWQAPPSPAGRRLQLTPERSASADT